MSNLLKKIIKLRIYTFFQWLSMLILVLCTPLSLTALCLLLGFLMRSRSSLLDSPLQLSFSVGFKMEDHDKCLIVWSLQLLMCRI